MESSLVLVEKGVCYDQSVLLAELLLAIALPYFVLQGQTALLLQVSAFAFQSPVMKRTSFYFGVNSRRSWRSSQNHSTSGSSALCVEA